MVTWGTLEISFDYLEHQDDGDFFSVDSYTHEDGINYELIPYYPYSAQGAAAPNRQNLESWRLLLETVLTLDQLSTHLIHYAVCHRTDHTWCYCL